jgi:hypothetical protein
MHITVYRLITPDRCFCSYLFVFVVISSIRSVPYYLRFPGKGREGAIFPQEDQFHPAGIFKTPLVPGPAPDRAAGPQGEYPAL